MKIGTEVGVTPGMGAADALDPQRQNTVWLDAGMLNGFQLGALDLASGGRIVVSQPLVLADGGRLSLVAPLVDIDANLTARGGTVNVSNLFTRAGDLYPGALMTADGTSQLTLEAGRTIDVRGVWTNARMDPAKLAGLAYINGGNITIDGSQDVTIAGGSVIDVSSGAAILANGKTMGGKGGNVTLIAGDVSGGVGAATGNLVLDGLMRAAGVNGGGTLTLSSPNNVLVGENASLAGGVLAAGTPAPLRMQLTRPLTIAAGQPLPFTLTETHNTLPLDVPVPIDVSLSGGSGIPTAADWVVANGMSALYARGANGNLIYYSPGQVVPAGTLIIGASGSGTIPAGTVIPSSVFPQGLQINPYRLVYAAGSVQAQDMTYQAGTVIPPGTALPQTVSVAPAPALSPAFFRAGFSNYDINAGLGMLVAGSAIAPAMPVYRIAADSLVAPSGSDPSSAMSLWLPPLYAEHPQSATLTQRGGASLTLRSQTRQNGILMGGGSIMMEKGASIAVDPGQSIKIDATGQIDIEGTLTAHGGSISLVNEADGSIDTLRNFDAAGVGRGVSVWVGPSARLDVSGQAYAAVDAQGRPYGTAPDGGTIRLSGGTAFVVVRPGAELDADGTRVVVDAGTVNAQAASGGALTLASNGGAISLDSLSGLYLDGTLHAASGGAGASGGSLSIALLTPYFSNLGGALPANVLVPSTMTVVQAQPSPSLSADLAAGTNAAALALGRAAVSADAVKAGGFDALALRSGDYMQFSGDVSLALGKSVSLTAGAFTSGPVQAGSPDASTPPARGSVRIAAPYVLLSGVPVIVPDGNSTGTIGNPRSTGTPTVATFEVDAKQIDIQGLLAFSAETRRYDSSVYDWVYSPAPGFRTTRLVSQGDIRFLPTTVDQGTMLASAWDVDLQAAQVYPATNARATVIAGQNNPGYVAKLTIGRTTPDVPDAPLSVFGSLSFQAAIIEQGGIVRAPFGAVTLGTNYPATQRVDLLPGSLTSVSMAGLAIPYGGTIDGVTYTYGGASVLPLALTGFTGNSTLRSGPGITLDAQAVNVQGGATLDLSGGGTLAGAGFVSGRGGSVNILTTPLVNANPATPLSKASDKVYAILPGYASGYAPVAPENGAGDPAIGQQITAGAGVPGLPAGTYTLLPSNYALLPGAYRVELGAGGGKPLGGVAAVGNGTYATAVQTGIANTGFRGALPLTALITPATAVRRYAQYNEQGYADFFTARAAQFGGLRPLLPGDGKILQIAFEQPGTPSGTSALSFAGAARLRGEAGGIDGSVALSNVGEIVADAATPGFGGASVRAADLNAIAAPRLLINGTVGVINGTLMFQGGQDLAIRDGVTLQAGELVLVGGNIGVGNNVTLSTIGQGGTPFDSASTGMGYTTGYGTSVLALSNGKLDFLGSQGSGAITIGAGSQLYSEGTLAFATNGGVNMDSGARFGSRNIALAMNTINVGSSADIAAAGVQAGLLFDQALFNRLVSGDLPRGVPALQTITLGASSALNLFGSAGLDATGTGVNLVLNTPAIYGWGGAGDHATIAAGKITWNGIAGATPPATVAGGPGTGLGTLDLVAKEIDLGQFVSLDNTKASRTAYGFGNVNLKASEKIVSAGNGSLFVYQAASADSGAVFGQSGTGGNLTLATPLLTGMQKSIMAYTAGGALNVVAPQGQAPSQAGSTIAGAEIDLGGDSVAIGSTILLPSGKLVVNATHDIVLDAGSRIDLSGQPSTIQRATVHGFGGTATFNSAQGGVAQAAGAVIDVSAIHANAGEIAIDAGNGLVALNGTLNGGATDGQASGDFSARAATFADFAGLNAALTRGGFFDARSFTARQGDLVVGDGVKAHRVSIATDGGQLTVTGTIDASGAAPGTIRLSAANGLTLASGAVLDAHGTVLQADSYGLPIEARNRGHVELSAAHGVLTLLPGATIDLSTPGSVAYGDVVLNAQRVGATAASATGAGAPANATGNDVAISAAGPLTIRGARSIQLNGFATYANAPADPGDPAGQVITQGWLDLVDRDSQVFMAGALANAGLQGRMAGLSAYGSALHLRPGVEVVSATPQGNLTVSGDIDLAGYRYGPGADRDTTSASYGAGEPLALVIRAGGNLAVKGSISDGFRAVAGKPAVYDGILDITSSPEFSLQDGYWGTPGASYVASKDVYLMTSWTVPNDDFYNYLGGLIGSDGTIYYVGDTIPAGTKLSASDGLLFEAGIRLPGVATTLVSKGTPGAAAASAAATMLAAGAPSASLRLVAGADLAGADQRALQTVRALNGGGNLTLSDPSYDASLNGTFFSVLRTGTGNLELLAGGSFSEATPYGVYTAGTQSAPILAADGSNPYDIIATRGSGLHAWYPEHGGDLLLMAQQDVTGSVQIANNNSRYVDSDLTGNWLWRQGGGASADPTAWWINFGALTQTSGWKVDSSMTGFQGIGTLGGGNLTVIAGRNAGVTGSGSTGLDLAVASTGRVLADGTMAATGGGDLTLKIGGGLNAVFPTSVQVPDYYGAITNLRGDINVNAGSIGALAVAQGGILFTSFDPRAVEANVFKRSAKTPGPTVTPGDGVVNIATRGDLVIAGAADAGMGTPVDQAGIPYLLRNADGSTTLVPNGGTSAFTLWTPGSAIQLYSAGGDVAPLQGGTAGNNVQNSNGFYPGTLIVAAANGDIRFAEPLPGLSYPVLELVPSPRGQLELLAAGSIYGSSQVVAMSGADMSTLATPWRPVFETAVGGGGTNNASPTSAYLGFTRNSPIAFGPDTPLGPLGNLHAADEQPALVYAGKDIVDLALGQVQNPSPGFGPGSFQPFPTTWYAAAKPFQVIAGRDIVGTGTTPSAYLNLNADDITLIQAGRDIFRQSVTIAGPGLLQLQAGRNLYQGYDGALTSAGDVVNPSNKSGGAGITVLAGVGANGPDYAGFARLYLDAANQLNAGTPLAGSGKVAHAYDAELLAWLQQRFGYKGAAADALAYFLALPGEQQGVFVRQVYFQELLLGGREYNDPASSRYGSYLRGREAIATLFPSADAQGRAIGYQGDITMFSSITGSKTVNGQAVPVTTDAGIHTNFGGDIQMLNPGGKTLIGVEGVPAGTGAGLITQGAGDIALYSKGSILLGLSRIMTTFGGSIQGWSSEGDINAGRGAKTTVLYTPPKRVYDGLGNVTVSPNVPSSGAGIATLSPIPEVPPGDVDLVAPLGTIDAGEAGIRVSGNVNFAALQVVNAANVQVQGKSTGLPVVATVNVGAMTNASSTASQAAAAAQDAMSRDRAAQRQNLPSIFTVRMLDAGTESSSPADGESRKVPAGGLQSSVPYDAASPVQFVGLGGRFNPAQLERLTDDERRNLKQIR
ncbi:filamentous hemagglutinin family protein [Cupriavidus basilensis]|uniref:Filamentous hemagglutinin family protein n=1 Tax=Cupriavidus basilensis TaxID=68895 RepID=A0ABT6ATC8_9BURK|nr:filamentous haemagglutinin family protein [Cupriavidus basilensis]MDF3835855.1 filamentous hemagglutinin family protein [Cupriavidus basilensis]